MNATTSPGTANTDALADFILGWETRALPDAVREAASFAITDWFGVALGAGGEDSVGALRRTVAAWQAQGRSQMLLAGRSCAMGAALVNGTMAHTLDFDDTHVGSLAHVSGPAMAAALAVGQATGATPAQVLQAFVTGFEVGARCGGGGLGVAVNERHVHSTGVFGCLAAAAAAAALYRLDMLGVRRALGLAATQVGGLTVSFGTTAKPFHAGRAAMSGVLAAEMAREGYHASLEALEPGRGLDRALVQDGSTQMQALDFNDGWELTRNTYKPYASCLLTHPVIDACRELAAEVDRDAIAAVQVDVHPLAIQLAGKPVASTPFEGKFSLAFCVALALSGKRAMQTDFCAATVADAQLQALTRKVVLRPSPSMALTEARVAIDCTDGRRASSHVPLALGNPGRPMSWDDLRFKFLSLAEPQLGSTAQEVFSMLSRFAQLRELDTLLALTKGQG